MILIRTHSNRCSGQTRRNRCRELRQINQISAARVQRNWKNTPGREVSLSDEDRIVATDLGIFGAASLFQLVCNAETAAGIRTLRDWLIHPTDPTEIRERQQAIAELSSRLDYRQELNAVSRSMARTKFVPDDFLEWAEGRTYLSRKRSLVWLVRTLPIIVLSMPSLTLLGVLPQHIGMPIMTTAIAVNILLTVAVVGTVHDIFRIVCPAPDGFDLDRLQRVFTKLSNMNGESRTLVEIQETASTATAGLKQLQRIMKFTSLSRNAITAVPVYLPLQFTVLWDFQILQLLEDWQQKHGHQFRNWLDALGKFEATESLAALAHDNPKWSFPEVGAEHNEQFIANQLGHPLLAESVRVLNDVTIGPAGRMLLVTGSNMSGKSTLLRSIGINAVLAQAGVPVCAHQLQMPFVKVVTSMRFVDALQDGVSLYMAEVCRLKKIVDTAREFSRSADESKAPPVTLLFLLDEILHGTNSAERQIATQRVLSHLLQYQVIGAVSTHDLQLAEVPGIQEASEIVHFRESLEDNDDQVRMTFDYTMRPGIAPTTNAVKLLEMVGL